jgi:hypothetical protein
MTAIFCLRSGVLVASIAVASCGAPTGSGSGPADLEEEDGDDEEVDDDDEGEDGTDEADDAPRAAAAAMSGPSLTPLADGVRFSHVISHPYFPISDVPWAELRSDDERVICEVLADTKTVGGVECAVYAEEEHEQGELSEISYNYFAQDEAGNVWYFGEDVDDYEDGKVVGHGGAWLVGSNAAEPCLFMPARLDLGFEFKRENSPPAAEEFDAVEAIDAALSVPAGKFEGVLVVKEADRRGRWKERKYYARGVGIISENEDLNLVSYRRARERR